VAERAERPCAAVLGAGAGGRACAADLALHGWRVRLWELPRFADNIAPLMDEPRLAVSGVVEAEVELDSAGVDLGHACDGASLIMVVTQALAHAEVAARLAQVIADDQLLFVNPGSTGGALEFARILRQRRGSAPTIAETATLTHAARVRGERGVFIARRVKLVKTAALPASETQRVVRLLRPVFPGLEPAQSVLETMLSNGNPVIHPAIMLSNAALVERAGGDWEFYRDGVTPGVADLIRAADEERLALGHAVGVDLLPEPEMSLRQGYSESADYLECYRDGPGFQGLGAPASLQHRYLLEDVACGLVTMLELGEVFGVELPTMAAIVEVASVLLGRDLRLESRRGLAALGLAGLTAENVVGYLQRDTAAPQ
jgi:opine dehydrogenase